MLEQRSNETKEEFYARKHREAMRTGERLRRLYDFAPEPKDLYADSVTLYEENGILRLTFESSRPETDDGIGAWSVPVARISFRFKAFRLQFETWLANQASLDAPLE